MKFVFSCCTKEDYALPDFFLKVSEFSSGLWIRSKKRTKILQAL